MERCPLQSDTGLIPPTESMLPWRKQPDASGEARTMGVCQQTRQIQPGIQVGHELMQAWNGMSVGPCGKIQGGAPPLRCMTVGIGGLKQSQIH